MTTDKTRDEIIKIITDRIDGDVEYNGSSRFAEKLATEIVNEVFGEEKVNNKEGK